MTLKQAKDEVAKKRGYKNFQAMEYNGLGIGTGELLGYADEAAELYAKSKWDEACEAQREICADQFIKYPNAKVGQLAAREYCEIAPKPEFKP